MESDATLRSLSTVHYYLREGYFGTSLPYCESRGTQEAAEHQLAVLKGVALALLGKSAESLRVLDPLKNGPCNLGVLHAQKYAHQIAVNPDKKSLADIETDITNALRTATDVEQLSAAEVLFFTGQPARAKSLLEKQAQAQMKFDVAARNPKLLTLLGWIDLAMGKDQKSTKEMFESAATLNYPDGFVGRGRLCELHHSAQEMRAIAKELGQTHVAFYPAHIERCRAALVDCNWDTVLEAIQNSSLSNESENAYMSLLNMIHSICSAGFKSDHAMVELKSTLEGAERENHRLLFNIAQLLIRCANRNRSILGFAKSLLARAIQLSSKDEYLVEELRLSMALEDSKDVLNVAKDVIQTGHSDPFAILGMCIGYLMAGKVKEAAEQFEFVNSVHSDVEGTTVYMFVAALMARYKNNNFEEYIQKMDKFVTTHQSQVQSNAFGLKYLLEMDIELLLTAVYTLLDYSPVMPTRTPSTALRHAERILSWILEKCPGMTTIGVNLARIQYLSMDYEAAERTLDVCLEKNNTVADAHLLKAQILIDRGRGIDAEKCLSMGLSFNFDVRETSLYRLVIAKVHRKKNEMDEAIKQLRDGLAIPPKAAQTNLLAKREPADAHRISIQLELIDCLQSKKKVAEAEDIMRQAMAEWKGKGEEGQLVLLNADLYLSKGDVDGALAILNGVKTSEPNYQSARIKMAEIHLDYKRDRRAYIHSFRELLPVAQTSGTYVMIGDAYMNIQEPEKAIEMYETALKKNPKDLTLTEKIGEAYIMCHLYTKAANFYESMMKQNKGKEMRLKLADLLLKLEKTDKCEAILKQTLANDPSPIDQATVSANIQYLQILAKLHLNEDKRSEALDDLTKARALLEKLTPKNDVNTSGPAKKELARVLCLIGDMHFENKELDQAMKVYKEAAFADGQYTKAQLQIAAVYLAKRDLQLCIQTCLTLVNRDSSNLDAHLMIADVHYLKNETDQALAKYKEILVRQYSNYHALERYIELSWRSGASMEAKAKLDEILHINPRVIFEYGFSYCKGLHEWYSGEANAALQCFNRSKKDGIWGDKSLCNIIEICLNPENEIIGAEALEESVETRSTDEERELATKTAEGFLEELKQRGQEAKCLLMENFILVRSGDKSMVNQALQTMLNMIGPDEGPVKNVGAVLGSAQALIYLKQAPKAKTVLKRVSDAPWTVADSYYLERCWLLLAEIYVSQNKPDQANALLNNVLMRNLSCVKAYELQGHIKEKESNYLDASSFYQHAWEHSLMKNLAIGYKLAYNYLKCRKLFECLEVCDVVLTKYPNYPKLRKEIQEKARNILRT